MNIPVRSIWFKRACVYPVEVERWGTEIPLLIPVSAASAVIWLVVSYAFEG